MSPPALFCKNILTNMTLRLSPPKAVLQLAWRPSARNGDSSVAHELAIAGEDSSLRLYAFSEAYLEQAGA